MVHYYQNLKKNKHYLKKNGGTKMKALIMEANRTGYGKDQIRATMTVGDLIAFLEEYDEDTLIYTSQHNG